jgi:hypothetical protein
MTEDYLHYIWKYGLFEQQELRTTNGELLVIKQRGKHNQNAGPDFLEARISMGDKDWAGQVEIHVQSSDWNKHKHHTDKAFNNVVLHVVYEHDGEVFRESGTAIPTLELKGRFDEMGYWRYEQFVRTRRKMACENLLQSVDDIHIRQMLDRTLIERMEDKSEWVDTIHKETNSDWSETFYCMLLFAFGLKVNAETMLALASRLPLNILRKHKGNAQQVEALFFGTAGLLRDESDDYQTALKREFEFLRRKYGLEPLPEEQWKFARMRPMGFPTVRLAQLSAIFNGQTEFFDLCTSHAGLAAIRCALSQKPNQYWQNHYRFGKVSPTRDKTPAAGLVDLVLINALIPTLFAYATLTKKQEMRLLALDWLQEIKPEKNNVISHAKKSGIGIASAYDSQAVLQLNKCYCGQRKCLNCTIGVKLLKQ